MTESPTCPQTSILQILRLSETHTKDLVALYTEMTLLSKDLLIEDSGNPFKVVSKRQIHRYINRYIDGMEFLTKVESYENQGTTLFDFKLKSDLFLSAHLYHSAD